MVLLGFGWFQGFGDLMNSWLTHAKPQTTFVYEPNEGFVDRRTGEAVAAGEDLQELGVLVCQEPTHQRLEEQAADPLTGVRRALPREQAVPG